MCVGEGDGETAGGVPQGHLFRFAPQRRTPPLYTKYRTAQLCISEQKRQRKEKQRQCNISVKFPRHSVRVAYFSKIKNHVKAREGFSNRRFERRFWVLLPPWAKVPRAGARNIPLDNPPRGCSAPVGAAGGCGHPPLRTAIGGHSVGGDAHIAPQG